jgi:hypothetical protein
MHKCIAIKLFGMSRVGAFTCYRKILDLATRKLFYTTMNIS